MPVNLYTILGRDIRYWKFLIGYSLFGRKRETGSWNTEATSFEENHMLNIEREILNFSHPVNKLLFIVAGGFGFDRFLTCQTCLFGKQFSDASFQHFQSLS